MEIKYKADGSVDSAATWAQFEPAYKAMKATGNEKGAEDYKAQFDGYISKAKPKAAAGGYSMSSRDSAVTPEQSRAKVEEQQATEAKRAEEDRKAKAAAAIAGLSKSAAAGVAASPGVDPQAAVNALAPLSRSAASGVAAATGAAAPVLTPPVEGAQVLRSPAGEPDIASTGARHGFYLDKLKGVSDPEEMANIAYSAISERLAGVNRDSQIGATDPILDEWLALIGDGVDIKTRREQNRWTPAQKALLAKTEAMTKGSEIDKGNALEAAKAASIPGYTPVDPVRTDIVPMAVEAAASELRGDPAPTVEEAPAFLGDVGGGAVPPPALEALLGALGGAPVSAPPPPVVEAGIAPEVSPYSPPDEVFEPEPEIVKALDGTNGVEGPPEVTGQAPAQGADLKGILDALGKMGIGILDIAQAYQAGKAGVTDPSKLAYRVRAGDEQRAAEAAQSAKLAEEERAFRQRLEEMANESAASRLDRELAARAEEQAAAQEYAATKSAGDIEMEKALMDYENQLKAEYLRLGASLDEAAALAAHEREKALMQLEAQLSGDEGGAAGDLSPEAMYGYTEAPALSSGLSQ